jgi:hypothetical protein
VQLPEKDNLGNQICSHSIIVVVASSKLIHGTGPNDTRAQKRGEVKQELGYTLSIDSLLLIPKHLVLAVPRYPLLPNNSRRSVVR